MKDHECLVATCKPEICCYKCKQRERCTLVCQNLPDKCGMYYQYTPYQQYLTKTLAIGKRKEVRHA